ncbi:TRAP transporter small permease [Virgibacillus sp. W0181]|uniref:TRAP transporter small permease n=1 Tax=Virgibacillus sp. W0181 TaxID=3391581 RepID=UPI003F457BED
MKLKTILNEKLEEWILVVSLAFIVLLVIAQVVSRYVITFPMGWSVELARYILIWIAWISASYAVQQNTHIRVEILKDKLSKGPKKVLELIILVMWFAFALFLAIAGTQFTMSIGKTTQYSPSLEVPMWIVYLGVPIAGFLMSIRLFQQAMVIIRKGAN